MIIRNKKTGEIREVSMSELNQYGLGGQHNKLIKYQKKGEVKKAPSVVRTKKDLITNRENVSGDSFTGTMRREALAYLPYFKDAMRYLEKGISYVSPDYKSQADRELIFKRHRPVAYPTIADAGIDLLKDYSHSLFNTSMKKPFIDPEGDYEASEEAWRMSLGLPVKSKYIIPSKYRPLNEENKTSKYYTLREDMYNKDLLRQKIKELKLKPGQSVFLPSFAPFVNESYMNQKEFSDVDPLQNFKIGVNKNGKMYFYDKYDFDFEPLSKVTRPYEYEFYNELKTGGEMIKRADGSYSRRGLWDNIRANAGSGKRPTKEMLNQERKIRNQYEDGGEEEVYWRTKQPMVNDPSMDAISKVLLQRNIDKNFIQRAAGFGNQNGIPTRYIDGQDPDSNNMSNLLMGFGDNYVSPTIIETFPNFLGNNSTMLRTAPGQLSYQPNQIQEYIKTPTVDIADYFATKGYKRAANDMYGMQYQDGGDIPTIEGPSGYMNEDDVWIVDNETIKRQAQELGAKKVLTEGGSLIIFDDNWNIVATDDNPDAPYKQGGSVTLNAGGENHRIYIKTTNRGEGEKGHIMVNHPTMDKGMWDTIDLTQKSGATTIAQGVAATKKWHMENPYMKKYGGQPMYAYGGLVKYKEKGEVKKTKSPSVVKKPVYEYKPQNLVAPSFSNLGQTTYASVPLTNTKEQRFLSNIKTKAAEERKKLAAKKSLPSDVKNMDQIVNQENYIKLVEGPKAKKPYAIVDKVGNVIRYYDENHKMIKEEPVITGESYKDVDKELSWNDFLKLHPTGERNSYLDYLQATNNKTTPSGLFKLHYKDDVLENPSTKGKIADMIIPGHKQKTIDARSHTYGNSGKMFTLESQYGIPSSKAIHGTGYEDRLAAFINGTDRNLSNGCINVAGKTICFDFLKEGSNLYVLPEKNSGIVTYKNSLYGDSGKADPVRTMPSKRVNEIRETKNKFSNISKAANLGLTEDELNFATSVAEKESQGGRSMVSKIESNLLPGNLASSYGKFEMKKSWPWLKGGNPNNDTTALKAIRDFYRERYPSYEGYDNKNLNNSRLYTEYNTGKRNNEYIWGEDYFKNLYPLTEYNKGGGIPERYRNMGFTNVGAKKQSTRPGKKWMVLAKKGDDYKVVHGGYKGMQDFKQHHSEQRKENFWSRMGGRNSSKATDPFSPLYWHKRFGTWEQGGEIPKAQNGLVVKNYIQQTPYVNNSTNTMPSFKNFVIDQKPVIDNAYVYQNNRQANTYSKPSNVTKNKSNKYNDIYEKTKKYLARDVFAGASLKAEDIANAMINFEAKTGYKYPLDLLLSQAQIETHFGKELKSKHNYFNVGNDDDGNVINFASPEESILNYMNLMYNDYLQKGKKDYHDLLVDKKFVNYQGNRYASNPTYERELKGQSEFINRFLNKKKKGGQYMAVGGQNVMNPIVKKDNRNWLEYLKN